MRGEVSVYLLLPFLSPPPSLLWKFNCALFCVLSDLQLGSPLLTYLDLLEHYSLLFQDMFIAFIIYGSHKLLGYEFLLLFLVF